MPLCVRMDGIVVERAQIGGRHRLHLLVDRQPTRLAIEPTRVQHDEHHDGGDRGQQRTRGDQVVVSEQEPSRCCRAVVTGRLHRSTSSTASRPQASTSTSNRSELSTVLRYDASVAAADSAGSGPKLIDISAPLHEGLVTWPGVVERFDRSLVASIDAGDAMTVSHLHLGAHAGTHIDAPCHFLAGAGGIETVRLDALLGPAYVVEVPVGARVITAEVLQAADVPAGTTRLLARTANSGWSRSTAKFREDYVAFDASAAQWCLDRSMVLVGIDYLSVEAFNADEDGFPVHRALLGAGVAVLESLDLDGVAAGVYELTVLPLLVPGADGAPARAVLRAT